MKYVAPEDIIVYSIDEVFMDVTDYLATYKLSPHDLAMKIILDVLSTTGITATAGIGSNLYLCKVAMDIVAKHIPADKNGVRIAELDEMSYRKTLWSHQPLTDFWRVGKGYAKKLEENGMFTMGDVARRSITDEDLLYKLFGKNAELLIDHAWAGSLARLKLSRRTNRKATAWDRDRCCTNLMRQTKRGSFSGKWQTFSRWTWLTKALSLTSSLSR